jgi:hypothetical protein
MAFPRSEKLLLSMMINARYPAGRLGAINGYRFIVQRRKTFTNAELTPLRKLARSDPSKGVRDEARFEVRRLSELRYAQEAS